MTFWQGALSNITFIIFCCFRCMKQCTIAVNSVINWSFFYYFVVTLSLMSMLRMSRADYFVVSVVFRSSALKVKAFPLRSWIQNLLLSFHVGLSLILDCQLVWLYSSEIVYQIYCLLPIRKYCVSITNNEHCSHQLLPLSKFYRWSCILHSVFFLCLNVIVL